jgi:hypothetical protein
VACGEDALGQRLSQNQKDVNTAHARQRGPGERANAQLKSRKVLRFCPARATELVNAVQVLILAG